MAKNAHVVKLHTGNFKKGILVIFCSFMLYFYTTVMLEGFVLLGKAKSDVVIVT